MKPKRNRSKSITAKRQPTAKAATPHKFERVYYPELAEWLPAGLMSKKSADKTGVEIHERERNPKLIATIHVNPEIGTPEDRQVVANLMSYAPAMWRLLQRLAWHFSFEIDDVFDRADIEFLLWDAADRRPFDGPKFNDEERIYAMRMRRQGYAIDKGAVDAAKELIKQHPGLISTPPVPKKGGAA